MITLPHRPTALWTLCLLLLSWGAEAGGAHACAHHDRIGPAAAHAPPHAPAHHHGGPGGAPEPEQHEACTCLTSCPAAGAAALPRHAEPALAVVPDAERLAARPAEQPRPRLRPHLLPYAQAPPVG